MKIICKRFDNNYLQSNEFLYKDGEEVLVDYPTFEDNFSEFTLDILDKVDWDNIVVAGGAVLQCLLTKKNKYYHKSDVDIFIYGEEEQKKKTFNKLVKYFSRFGEIEYEIMYSVVNITLKMYTRKFQIIYSNSKTKVDVIKQFDADYIKVLYDGKQIICSNFFITALKTQTTNIVNNSMIIDSGYRRIVKALDKGFSIRKWNFTLSLQENKQLNNQESKQVVNIFKTLPLDIVDVISDFSGYKRNFLRKISVKDGFFYSLTSYEYPEYVIQRFQEKERLKRRIRYNIYDHSDFVIANFSYEPLKSFNQYIIPEHVTSKKCDDFYVLNNVIIRFVNLNYDRYSLIIDYDEKLESEYRDVYNKTWETDFYQNADSYSNINGRPFRQENFTIRQNKIIINNIPKSQISSSLKPLINKRINFCFKIQRYKTSQCYGYKVILQNMSDILEGEEYFFNLFWRDTCRIMVIRDIRDKIHYTKYLPYGE